jgi:hypothetical protein
LKNVWPRGVGAVGGLGTTYSKNIGYMKYPIYLDFFENNIYPRSGRFILIKTKGFLEKNISIHLYFK